MNLTPNSSLSGFFNEYLNSAESVAAPAKLSEASDRATASLAAQDWFSAQSLDQGELIVADKFAGSTEFASIEHAVEGIHLRLLTGTDGS